MAKSTPKVSVVVPCYNHGHFLKRRLEGIFAQTWTDFEWIFLDDASTDDSREVFESYRQEPRLTATVFNAKNSGNLYIQWNEGFHRASGEYIWIAESDDEADPTFLERLVATLDAHPSVGIAYCQSQMVDEEGKLLYSGVEHTRDIDAYRWLSDYIENGRRECNQYLARRNTIPNVSACLLRRSVVDRAGYAHTESKFCEDWLLYVRMLQLSDVAFLAESLSACRCHSASTRMKNSRHGEIEEFYRVLRELRTMQVGTPESLEFLAKHIFGRWSLLRREMPRNFSIKRRLCLMKEGFRSDPYFLKRLFQNFRKG